MPDIIVKLPGKGQLTFPDGTPDSVIDETITREFPKDGADVARIIAEDPTQAKSLKRRLWSVRGILGQEENRLC